MTPDMEPEWTGNPLAVGGTRCTLGGIVADLMRFDAGAVFGVHRMPGSKLPVQLRRSWLLYIADAETDLRIGDRCLVSVVLPNMMIAEAKRQAEVLVRWAANARQPCGPAEE